MSTELGDLRTILENFRVQTQEGFELLSARLLILEQSLLQADLVGDDELEAAQAAVVAGLAPVVTGFGGAEVTPEPEVLAPVTTVNEVQGMISQAPLGSYVLIESLLPAFPDGTPGWLAVTAVSSDPVAPHKVTVKWPDNQVCPVGNILGGVAVMTADYPCTIHTETTTMQPVTKPQTTFAAVDTAPVDTTPPANVGQAAVKIGTALKKASKVTAEEYQHIRDLLKKGMGTKEVAAQVGRGEKTVRDIRDLSDADFALEVAKRSNGG